jgi:hypothetical protein
MGRCMLVQSVLATHSTQRFVIVSQMAPPPPPFMQLALLRQATQWLVAVLQNARGRAHCMSLEQVGTQRYAVVSHACPIGQLPSAKHGTHACMGEQYGVMPPH